MSDSSSPGPALPPSTAPAPAPAPAPDNSTSRKRSRSPPPSPEKRQRTIGPTLPPPQQADGDNNNSDSDSDSSDDEFGPQLPSAADTSTSTAQPTLPDPTTYPPNSPATKPASKRDEWMLLPPTQDDWSSRIDPTKLKSRGFSTGKGAKGPAQKGDVGGGTWTETAEEKRRRLQNEVMGVQEKGKGGGKAAGPSAEEEHSREMARKVEEFNQKSRNTTLYKDHNKKTSKGGDDGKEKEDDPSARPFDKEKDIRGPSKISHAQQREMVAKATDFGSRFTKGKFL
ncbi:hypothetical protein FQN54_003153 [Arachnomyces sp. PD_36]|nr:hypothetical protein FQN54_003153 [Arachnomyces sp. PD_36]